MKRRLLTFLIFSFFLLIFSLLSACSVSWFDDLEEVLEGDTSSTIRFYARTLEEDSQAQCVEVVKKIGETLTSDEFPTSDFTPYKKGYHINYWKYYRDSATADTTVPSNVYLDSSVKEKVSSIDITPAQPDLCAVWAPNTDTKYTVKHYFQNLTLDGYDENTKMVQTLQGTTDTQTAAVAGTVTGFEAQAVNQTNIEGDESAVVSIYYDRKEITISVDFNNGTEAAEYTGYYGLEASEVSIPDRTEEGYIFKQWNITYEDETTDTSDTAAITYPSQKAAYVLEWQEIPYDITWVLQPDVPTASNAAWASGFTPVTVYTRSTGCTIPDSSQISRTGYTFQGWYTDSSYTTLASGWTSGQTGNKTFYAKWNVNTYTISYTANGGTLSSSEPSSYTIEDNVTLPSISYTGYTFGGWFAASDFSGSAYSSWSKGTTTGNFTMYAKWTEKKSKFNITVTYPSENDASLNMSVTYNSNDDKWDYSSSASYATYSWYYDGIAISEWTGNSASAATMSITLEAGYHSITLIVTDSSGNQYSATADIQIVK